MIPHANAYSGRAPLEPSFGRVPLDGYATVGLANPIRPAVAEQLATPREQYTDFLRGQVFIAKNPRNIANQARQYTGILPNFLTPVLDVPKAWYSAITGKGG